MRVYFSGSALTFLLLILAGVAAAQSAPTSQPDLNAIVSRMEQVQLQNRARMVPYTVTRRYELTGNSTESGTSAAAVADINFDPPDQKTYAIKYSDGGRVEKVVEKILDREADYARSGKKVSFSRDDYDFTYLGQGLIDAQTYIVLGITPKLQDKDLLKGKIYVDPSSYQIRRFEGQPAKNPSWWLKDVQLLTEYGQVGPMWLQTSSRGSANVRLFGTHVMTARDIGYRSEVARLQAPLTAKKRVRRPTTAVGAGILR